MKIFPVKAIAEMDAYTIENEPILSVNLMERAARRLFDRIKEPYAGRPFLVFAGPGNNGGDALVLARMLALHDFLVRVVLLDGGRLSPDAEINLGRLRHLPQVEVLELDKGATLVRPPGGTVVLDGLFGAGLNRPLEGRALEVVQTINSWDCEVLAIDLPSGLMGECNASNNKAGIVCATRTYSFEFPKLSFFFPDNYAYVGEWEVLPIGLHPEAINAQNSSWQFTEAADVAPLLPPRGRFMHKGHFGHALLIAGSYGKMGAAVLASRACMKSGVGLLTVQVPHKTCHVLHCAVPEAMLSIDRSDLMFTEFPDLAPFNAVGVGPAIGTRSNAAVALGDLLGIIGERALVLDADALNILAQKPELLTKLPKGAVLTPHPGEFKRLVGDWDNDYERLQKAVAFCRRYQVVLVLKGAWTTVVDAQGSCFFNSTGNPGMASAGSGDALTGLVLGFLAQGLLSLDAARLAVYVHGLAGDLAAEDEGFAALTASDLIASVGRAIKSISK